MCSPCGHRGWQHTILSYGGVQAACTKHVCLGTARDNQTWLPQKSPQSRVLSAALQVYVCSRTDGASHETESTFDHAPWLCGRPDSCARIDIWD